ncbi:PREDICTED: cell division cycle-associated 7-like protein [Gekko japonicus]|uniref:Cell division cycle-associated 7-like protein n=1 Tax=Gekko japonicus TaxID=146911 RepID=A0ABM1KIE5_GEKJA|nr:PREDICTED: cell division cycle-associated 7-like protein [Gekko japonicus]
MLELDEIFNTPSDDEEFLGFEPDVPMETLSLVDCFESYDSLKSRKMDIHLRSKYLTEELRSIFTEDTDSENEVFEGFSSNEPEVNGKKVVDSHLNSESDTVSVTATEEKEEKGRVSSKRRSFGFRVALQFPTKTSAEKRVPDKIDSKFCLKDSEHPYTLRRTKNNKTWKKLGQETSSESEEDAKEASKDTSSALLKRAMNIKENKAMLAQLLAELNSIPDLFPVKTPTSTPSKQKKTPKRMFSEGQIELRTNPTRNARPPENFGLENVTFSAVRFAEQLNNYRRQNSLQKRLKEDGLKVPKRRRSSKYCSFRPVEDITDEDLENIAITVKDKIYDKVLGSTCHQCRQKTVDTKTVCRNEGCGGVRGQFCGPCLRNRYGEDVKSSLLDPDWICPPCRGICNCSYCRKRDGRCATGMLIHLAKFYGYDNVKEYLESLQKQLAEDD